MSEQTKAPERTADQLLHSFRNRLHAAVAYDTSPHPYDKRLREVWELADEAEVALREHVVALQQRYEEAIEALHVAISAPKGVVPDAALPFYDPERYPRLRRHERGGAEAMSKQTAAPVTAHDEGERRREAVLRQMADALNDLLPLWITEHGTDWNAVDKSLDALAAARRLYPNLPITASYVDEVESRARATEGAHEG